MNSYRDLIVWQKSFALSKEIYRITGLFPKSETYGLEEFILAENLLVEVRKMLNAMRVGLHKRATND